MDPTLPVEIADLARSARQALADPNLDRARAAMAGDDASARADVVAVLERLGLHDLDVSDHMQALAAAHLALETGRVGNLAPVAAMVTARAAGRDGLVQAIPSGTTVVLVDHAGGMPAVAGVTLAGDLAPIEVGDAPVRPELAPFARPGRVGAVAATGHSGHWALYETLTAFAHLGAAQVGTELSREHLRSREQFGKPLAAQQALQHRFADMRLSVAALNELCHYTLWKLHVAPEKALVDTLALRVQHLETIRAVSRHAHQIHAAVGFCDEHALSIFSRSVRFAQYVPLSYDETIDAMVDHLDEGFDSLFPIHPLR